MSEWRPDLDWIEPDLAVGGSFDPARATILAEVHGVGAVIDLRGEGCDDAGSLRACGVEFLHLPTPDMRGVSQARLDAGTAFARQCARQERRLLIHCEHGIGRSALLALCVLVDRGAPPLEALERAKQARALISPSESQYRAWARWLVRNTAWPAPSYHQFGLIAYRHLAQPRKPVLLEGR